MLLPLSIQNGKKKKESKRKRWKGLVWMDTVEMAPRLHFSVADFRFCSWLTFFCLFSAMSPGPEGSGLLLLNTILHNWAQHAPLLGLPFLWLFFGSELSFGLFFVFDLWSCLVNLCGYKGTSWAKSEANYSLVWSWAVPKGVTFSIPSQGGRARSPFSTIPWKQMG